jgi:hypothetical protein
MCQTGLSFLDPTSVKAIIIADKDAFPVANEVQEGLLGPMRVDNKIADRRVCHDPQAFEGAGLKSRSLIHVVDPGAVSNVANGIVVRLYRFGRAVDHILYGAG